MFKFIKYANTYQTIGGLKQHLKKHDGGKFMCNVCKKKTFVYQSNLNGHSKVHSVEKYWKCPSKMCKQQFKSIGNYNCHMVFHEGKAFPCKELDCGYIRNTPHQLADNMVRKKGVKYLYCGKVFYHRHKLAYHMKK